MGLTGLFLGGAIGAAIAYFLDPERGAGRRNQTRDRLRSRARGGLQTAQATAQGAAQRTYGAAREATTAVTSSTAETDLNDPALARKVESEIFRDADAPKGDVDVNSENGVIVLRGEVESEDQIGSLERAARAVEGVRDVKNLLHKPGTPAPTA